MVYSVSHLSQIIAIILDTIPASLRKRAPSLAVSIRWYIEIILDTEESMDLTELIEAFFLGWQTWGEKVLLQGGEIGLRIATEAELTAATLVPIVESLT